MFAMFGVGPMEMLIIGFLCLGATVVPLIVVVLVIKTGKGSGGCPRVPVCPQCGAPLAAPGAACRRCAARSAEQGPGET